MPIQDWKFTQLVLCSFSIFLFFFFLFFWESIYQCALHIKISQPNNRIRASRLSVDEVATMKSQVQPITIPINLGQLIKVHIIGGNPTKLNKLIYQGCMKHAIEPICTTRTHNFCVKVFFFFLFGEGGRMGWNYHQHAIDCIPTRSIIWHRKLWLKCYWFLVCCCHSMTHTHKAETKDDTHLCTFHTFPIFLTFAKLLNWENLVLAVGFLKRIQFDLFPLQLHT